MQKKLLALAVAGLASSAAFAQSNVNIYGVADVYYGRATADGAGSDQTVINSGGLAGSRLGFKGTEDLGGGLKALFTLEYGLNLDVSSGIGATATGAGNTRQSLVGLSGNFGTAVLGRIQTAGYDWSARTNALHGTVFNPLDTVQRGMARGAGLLQSSSRLNNAVAYTSPNFGGFSVAFNHARISESANTVATNPAGDDTTNNLLTGTYASGPLTLSLAYANQAIDATAASDDIKEWGFGGSYDFGAVKLYASYQNQKNDITGQSDKAWNISGIVPTGGVGAVILGYAANKRDAANADTSAFTIAYKYNFSKRTALYAAYERVSNDGAAVRGTAAVAEAPVPTAGGDANLLVLGINHTF